ncbi:hypothetical protein ACFY8X_36055 [Streptomyces tanashiensis]|uniref:hypothetical protein n=1 Tax=Streptomyces tanashiensis TaxID=67367 RepID=UPI00198CF7D3|nr:hypothetical protein [Streptomyces tanashiensis]GGY52672.1 hypothetical protein GCM10010299_68540 [Streptomyces tanashiensis]
MNSRETRTVRSHPCAGAGCRRRRETETGRGRRAAAGTSLCPDCQGELLTNLRRLPPLYRACGQLLDGSRNVSGPRERTSGGGLPGLPFNTAASDARREALAVLGSWAGLVAEARRLPRPDRTVEALTAFLIRHSGWLTAHSAAGDASRELSEVTRRAARVATPEDQRRLVTVGACPEPGCAGRLQSLIRPDAAGAAPAVRCRADPAHHWAGEELMLLRRRLAAKAGTAHPPGAARPTSPRPSSPGAAHPASPDGAAPPASRAQGSSAPSGGGEADTVRIVWLSASDITRLWGTPSGSVYRLASQRAWRRRSRDGRTYYHEADVVRALSERHPRPVA